MSDLISRADALEAIKLLPVQLDAETVQRCIEAVSNLPSAQPVRHGKWIYGNDFHWYTASCNKCGYQRRTDIKADGWNQWKFCPNCGANMDAERKE